MVDFYHVTSIYFAKEIVLSQEFEPHSNLDDNGLNGFDKHTKSPNSFQLDGNPEDNRDAVLKFRWVDLSRKNDLYAEVVDEDYPVYKMKYNRLYRHGKFRLFLRAPYSGSCLYLIGIEIKKQDKFLASFTYPRWVNFIPFKNFRNKLKREYRLKAKNEFVKKYEGQYLQIKLVK